MVTMSSKLARLTAASIGETAATRLLDCMVLDCGLLQAGGEASRAEIAMALNVLLFANLLARVPTGAKYVEETIAADGQLLLDHGALRTISFAGRGAGALPDGIGAFSRILGPLGYEAAGDYPLAALRMTGQAWCHVDLPRAIPQFFVSELHVDRFPDKFAAAAERVFGDSRDPIDDGAQALLDDLAAAGALPIEDAQRLLPVLMAAFGRQHEPCSIADYETLLEHSAEAAWIATEGNMFNHATDRVPDVEMLAERLKRAGKPMKPAVERSVSGRVRQTAFRADPVERPFRQGDVVIMRQVPGSFYEFISRDVDPETGELDLRFDSKNAQGIFAMTNAGTAVPSASAA